MHCLPEAAIGSPLRTEAPGAAFKAIGWCWLALALLAFAAAWFGTLESRKLVKPDEGRYAEIAREMAHSGDWVTPRLNGIKYFEKPPLQYWMTATAYQAFGVHHWTARLWPALTGFLGVLAVWFTARRFYGGRAGWLASLTAGGCAYYVALGHINNLDMGLAFFMSVSVFAFLLAQQALVRREAFGWMMLSWAAAALAVLSKGLVALVLPGTALLVYCLVRRDWSVFRRLFPVPGTLLLLAVCVPWFAAVSLENREFAGFFFVHEHFTRFLTTQHHRVHPWWFFVPILLIGLLPWTSVMVGAVRSAVESRSGKPAFDPLRFLTIYCGVIFLFFSLSGSKLPSYILPMFPPLAVLGGWHLAAMAPRSLRWHVIPLLTVALLMIVLTPAAIHTFRPADAPGEFYEQFGRWIQAAGAVGAAAAAAAWWFAAKRRLLPAVAALAAGGLLLTQTLLAGHDSLNRLSSSYSLARTVAGEIGRDTPLFSVRMYDQTLPFYLGRTVTLVSYTDEFEFGLEQEPARALSLDAFREQWAALPAGYAVMGPDTFAMLQSEQFPMREIGRDPRRVVVSRR
jgi:4-amino-4-deoxy-L-arabinose transferase-like glycosyltransferase